MKASPTFQAISERVSDLPEIYQPIYGHIEFSTEASRSCEDRLERILQVYRALETAIGRPLRVLDIGCAQGYFSFNLAECGASVRGVDYLPQNINLCRTLAEEHPELDICFEIDRAEAVIDRITQDQYDLVLGLSVFHHVIHEHGVLASQKLLSRISETTRAAIFEFALKEEPLYWAKSQPDNPDALLVDFPFIHELSRHQTHLCEVARPLYVASRRYWVLDGIADEYDHWTDTSHALERGVHEGTRRYFISERTIVKLFKIPNRIKEVNFGELEQEKDILTLLPEKLSPPQLLAFGSNESEAWLARSIIPGTLFLDKITQNEPIDSVAVFKDVLQQAKLLEELGLYHNDIRTWNILITPSGKASLIDYGAISSRPRDCVWPDNIYLSLLVLAYEISTATTIPPRPIRLTSISPYNLPAPFNHWAAKLWSLPLEQWSFSMMLDAFERSLQVSGSVVELPEHLWMQKMEAAIQKLIKYGQEIEKNSQDAIFSIKNTLEENERNLADINFQNQQRFENLNEFIRRNSNRITTLESESRIKDEKIEFWRKRSEDAERQLQALLHSTSWKITKPVRIVSRASHYLLQKARAEHQAGNLVELINRAVKAVLRGALLRLMRYVLNQQELRQLINEQLNKYPSLHERLKRFAWHRGLIAPAPHATPFPLGQSEADLSRLTPRALNIYQELQVAMQKRGDK
ncbi:methyltransferase domain-containing protein [Pseudomonas knackmussii]|uniref:methyltransferase domain-containing protein n=1 Tax=Pseudomonas knackmussii TaxID=65741 RepID=UPI00136465B3|nr:methyltransferase domain-containing protein [Pseudomonas knackmussii]